jgi:hypothetical protein
MAVEVSHSSTDAACHHNEHKRASNAAMHETMMVSAGGARCMCEDLVVADSRFQRKLKPKGLRIVNYAGFLREWNIIHLLLQDSIPFVNCVGNLCNTLAPPPVACFPILVLMNLKIYPWISWHSSSPGTSYWVCSH